MTFFIEESACPTSSMTFWDATEIGRQDHEQPRGVVERMLDGGIPLVPWHDVLLVEEQVYAARPQITDQLFGELRILARIADEDLRHFQSPF